MGYNSAIKRTTLYIVCRDVHEPRICHTVWSQENKHHTLMYVCTIKKNCTDELNLQGSNRDAFSYCSWGSQGKNTKWFAIPFSNGPRFVTIWCFWTVVLEKTLEGPLDCKEIKPVSPKGNQSWIFIGRTEAEAEAPILWPPDAKNQAFWLTGKDPDAGKDWR